MSATATIADVLEGRARWCLVEGDNAEALPTLPAKSVAHVITDPPYSEHVHSKQRRSCLRSGRRFIGIERDPKYAQVARDRLAAESVGLTLRDARAGQQSLFGEVAP